MPQRRDLEEEIHLILAGEALAPNDSQLALRRGAAALAALVEKPAASAARHLSEVVDLVEGLDAQRVLGAPSELERCAMGPEASPGKASAHGSERDQHGQANEKAAQARVLCGAGFTRLL